MMMMMMMIFQAYIEKKLLKEKNSILKPVLKKLNQ
jgi:uncharacterized protein YlxP (DUF503 family)